MVELPGTGGLRTPSRWPTDREMAGRGGPDGRQSPQVHARACGYEQHRPPTYEVRRKPDLVAPGEQIMSTIPMPRDAGGNADPKAPRALMFGTTSGTSMATPAVSGACALIIQNSLDHGLPIDPDSVKGELFSTHVEEGGGPSTVMGSGRLALGFP